ncbi:MAG TPA: hypothetical protein VEI52_28195 [Terriglobales bacterium]|jgi:hypothetical protein|nr:hypothetical protein [Terriglobales bacterium]
MAVDQAANLTPSGISGFESNRPLEGSVQDALDGKNGKHVAHESVNNEFPLKGLVMCFGFALATVGQF